MKEIFKPLVVSAALIAPAGCGSAESQQISRAPIDRVTEDVKGQTSAFLAAEQKEAKEEPKDLWNLPDGDIPIGTPLKIEIDVQGDNNETKKMTVVITLNEKGIDVQGNQFNMYAERIFIKSLPPYQVKVTECAKRKKSITVAGTAVGVEGYARWDEAGLADLVEQLHQGKKVEFDLYNGGSVMTKGFLKPS